MPQNKEERSRNYCFTINNYTREQINAFTEIDCKYIIYGKEVGEGGTRHLQGFISFPNARSIQGIKSTRKGNEICRIALDKAHLEETCGTIKDAINYCKKGEQSKDEWKQLKEKGPNWGKNADVYERGNPPSQGKREDLERVYKECKEGKSVEDICWDDPDIYNCCYKTLEKIEDIRLRQSRRTEPTEGIWIYGKTGTGKSTYAYSLVETENYYSYPYDNDWWDDYRGEPVVIIDEFRGQIKFNELLRMCDRNPNFAVRRRCRKPMPFTSKKVIITSSMRPEHVFQNLHFDDKFEQFYRRFNIYEYVDGELKLANEWIEDP